MTVDEVTLETDKRKIRQRLEKVKRQIMLRPDLYDQSEWGDGYEGRDCGTACCIAGWLLRNEHIAANNGPVAEAAAKLIGVDYYNEEFRTWLFRASLTGGGAPRAVAEHSEKHRREDGTVSPATACMAIDAWMKERGI